MSNTTNPGAALARDIEAAGLSEQTFRVIARSLTDGTTREIAAGKSEKDAEAIVKMAVMRRGVQDECFYSEPAR